jgi:hypothetical protein
MPPEFPVTGAGGKKMARGDADPLVLGELKGYLGVIRDREFDPEEIAALGFDHLRAPGEETQDVMPHEKDPASNFFVQGPQVFAVVAFFQKTRQNELTEAVGADVAHRLSSGDPSAVAAGLSESDP